MTQKDLYVSQLLFNLNRFVQETVVPGDLITVNTFPRDCFVSQSIIGEYEAYTAVYGDDDALVSFAKEYSKFDLEGFDDLTREILADFLNLHNGLFAVELSDSNSVECSLTPPDITQQHDALLKECTTLIPIDFPYGQIVFVFSENK